MGGTSWGCGKQGIYQFASRRGLTEPGMGPAVCVAPNAGRERENNNDKKKKKKKITFQSSFGSASWSISASPDWVRPRYQQDTWRPVPVCLWAYVSTQMSQEHRPYRASGRLPNVIVAIWGIYKLPRCPRLGTRCPVNIKAAVYEQPKNNSLTREWLFIPVLITFMHCVFGLKVILIKAACVEAP